ncbi:MAG TPA: GspMb/PilO family protein [Verrucomicrobiales bacterium]|nr:GspMb/PilO family protein [Verrucomicrobiales bacterium]
MNPSHHRQAIVVFGIVIPFALIIGIVIASSIGQAKLQAKFAKNVAALERYQTAKTQAVELESMLSQDDRREKITYWNSKLEQDLVQSLTQNLNKILSKYDSEVLRQTEMGQAGGAGGIGTRTDHPNSRMQLSFEGGFKPMQMLLAELENEMPHLLLESISVRPQPAKAEGQKGTLQFGVVYLCWEKPKE